MLPSTRRPAATSALLLPAVEGQLVATVEDNGPGIPQEQLSSIFDAFVQGPRSLDRREGGLGLGLALARSFVDVHGGSIRVESGTDGRGCRFIVTLPLSAVDAPQVAPPAVDARCSGDVCSWWTTMSTQPTCWPKRLPRMGTTWRGRSTPPAP